MRTLACCLLLLVLLVFLLPKLKPGIDWIDFGRPSELSICFVGSVHGNEPAGCASLLELCQSGFFQAQTQLRPNLFIRVIPCVNQLGLRLGIRYQPDLLFPDINRNFGEEGGLDSVSRELIRLTAPCRVLIDIHEGFSFHLINPLSLGSTLSPGATRESLRLAERALRKVNQLIQSPLKRFTLLRGRACEIPGTLACWRKLRAFRKDYLLIETSGQREIQPLAIRKRQLLVIIQELLQALRDGRS